MEKWVQREEGLVSTSNQKALGDAGFFVCIKLSGTAICCIINFYIGTIDSVCPEMNSA